MPRRLVLYWGYIVGAIGIVATMLAGWGLYTTWLGGQTPSTTAAHIYILTVSAIVVIACSIRIWISIRKEKYANITSNYHRALHCLRDLETYLNENKPEKGASTEEHDRYTSTAKALVVKILDQICIIFQSITGTHCRSCIKFSYEFNGELFFYTYARDQGSLDTLREMDTHRAEQNSDPHKSNPTFRAICDTSEPVTKWHFLSNNLPNDPSFESTSFIAYERNFARRGRTHWPLIWKSNWPLPYRSCLSVAVRQGKFMESEQRQIICIGFLSVDSESRGVFEERWDKEIMYGFADALFNPLKRIIEAQQISQSARKT